MGGRDQHQLGHDVEAEKTMKIRHTVPDSAPAAIAESPGIPGGMISLCQSLSFAFDALVALTESDWVNGQPIYAREAFFHM